MSSTYKMMEYEREQFETFKESGDKEFFTERLRDRIQSVLDVAAGKRTWDNGFGLQNAKEVYHWRDEGFGAFTWVAGKGFPHENILGQNLVEEVMLTMGLKNTDSREEIHGKMYKERRFPYVDIGFDTYEQEDLRVILVTTRQITPGALGSGEALPGFTPYFDIRIDVMTPTEAAKPIVTNKELSLLT